MLQAYRNHVTMYGEDPPLPGIDLSHDQLFFLNFAQVVWLVGMDGWMDEKEQYLAVGANLVLSFQIWCSIARREHLISGVNSDTHSQGVFR